MKVVVSAQGEGLSDPLDPRFGRAKYFVCVDLENMTGKSVENRSGQDATQGAGISAARLVAGFGAQDLITGHVGPKAMKALKAAGIRVWLASEASVEQAVARFRKGELSEATEADVEGHW